VERIGVIHARQTNSSLADTTTQAFVVAIAHFADCCVRTIPDGKKTAVRSMLPTAVRRIVLKPFSYGVGLGFTETALFRPYWEFCTPFVRVAEFPCFKPKAELPWPALCVAPLVFRGPATARDAMVKPDIAISAIFPFMFVFMFFPFLTV
jgi:hypothetical protein